MDATICLAAGLERLRSPALARGEGRSVGGGDSLHPLPPSLLSGAYPRGPSRQQQSGWLPLLPSGAGDTGSRGIWAPPALQLLGAPLPAWPQCSPGAPHPMLGPGPMRVEGRLLLQDTQDIKPTP